MIRLSRLVLWLLLLPFGLSAAVKAQDFDPVTVGWFTFQPYLYEDENGELTGFTVDVARLLGEEIGFEVNFQRYASAASFIEALRSGQAPLFPFLAVRDDLSDAGTFSDPLAADSLRLAFATDGIEDLQDLPTSNLRIGVVKGILGWQDPVI